MLRDLSLFVPLALLLVIGVVIWAFRTWRGAAAAAGHGGDRPDVWTIGIMVLAGDAFTMGTLVLPPLLMASGVAYAIHVVSRYYIEVRRHAQPRRGGDGRHRRTCACRSRMAALTTLIGFGTFVTSPIPSIRDFGFYAGARHRGDLHRLRGRDPGGADPAAAAARRCRRGSRRAAGSRASSPAAARCRCAIAGSSSPLFAVLLVIGALRHHATSGSRPTTCASSARPSGAGRQPAHRRRPWPARRW